VEWREFNDLAQRLFGYYQSKQASGPALRDWHDKVKDRPGGSEFLGHVYGWITDNYESMPRNLPMAINKAHMEYRGPSRPGASTSGHCRLNDRRENDPICQDGLLPVYRLKQNGRWEEFTFRCAACLRSNLAFPAYHLQDLLAQGWAPVTLRAMQDFGPVAMDPKYLPEWRRGSVAQTTTPIGQTVREVKGQIEGFR
jgi:hypothetical protein